jgi:hypothetical protein
MYILDTLFVYEAQSNTQRDGQSRSVKRHNFGITTVSDKLVVCGGHVPYVDISLNTCEMYTASDGYTL